MKRRHLMLAAVLATGVSLTSAAKAAVIDLGFVLDESGSVGSTNFTTVKTALAAALGSIPTSGPNQYRVAVTTFSSGQTTVVAPTILTAANLATIKSAVTGTSYSGGGTDTAGAIAHIANLFKNSATGFGDTTLINITTDGAPNSQSGAENAALAAHNAGVEGISFEAVGSGVSSTSAQNNMARIAGLGTSGDATKGVVVSDLNSIPDATTTGFVIPVSTFAGYEAAIKAKIGKVVVDTGGGTSVVPLPAALPLMLAGFGALGGLGAMRRRKNAA